MYRGNIGIMEKKMETTIVGNNLMKRGPGKFWISSVQHPMLRRRHVHENILPRISKCNSHLAADTVVKEVFCAFAEIRNVMSPYLP